MFKKYFVAGLLVWLPIAATFFIIRFLVNLMDQTLGFLPTQYQPANMLGFNIPGLGFAVTILVIFFTGVFVANYVGSHIVAAWEKILSRIPLIRSIYSAVKQVTHALFNPNGNSFRKVLLIEYPRQGIWSIAFQTSEIKRIDGQEDLVTAFVPTTPNPTSGFLTLVPRENAIELDMKVEEALRLVISLGVVVPDDLGVKDETTAPTN